MRVLCDETFEQTGSAVMSPPLQNQQEILIGETELYKLRKDSPRPSNRPSRMRELRHGTGNTHPELIIDTGIPSSVTVGGRPMCEVHSSDSVQSEIESDGKRRWRCGDDMESSWRCHKMIWIWTDSAGSPPMFCSCSPSVSLAGC